MKGKAVQLMGNREIDFTEFDVPDPRPGEVLLKVERANICGSELHMWRGDLPAMGVPGHEMVGRIAKLGEGVKKDSGGRDVREGDLVAPVYFRTCGECPECKAGFPNACNEMNHHLLGLPEMGLETCGCFATHYLLIPGQRFFLVPDNVPPQIAATANCSMSQVYFGLDQVNAREGDTVYIQGAGGLGLHATALCKARGARVIIADGVPGRLEAAEAFGADEIIDIRKFDTPDRRRVQISKLTDAQGAHVVVELVGYPDAFSEALDNVRVAGRVLEMGNISPGLTTEIDVALLTLRNLRIAAVIFYDPAYLGKSLEFLAENVNKYPYDRLVDADFPLDEAKQALEKADKGELNRACLIP